MLSSPVLPLTRLSLILILEEFNTWPWVLPTLHSIDVYVQGCLNSKAMATFIWRIIYFFHNESYWCASLLMYLRWSCCCSSWEFRCTTVELISTTPRQMRCTESWRWRRKRDWRFDRFGLKPWEEGCLVTWGQYSQTSFHTKYIFNLCSFINQQNHFKMNSTLLSLLVALTVLYHEFVSLCNSSSASLHTKYVLYEPSFIMACQLLTVSLFSLEL